MSKNLSITKSNSLIKSSYRLSLNEMRVVIYGISLVNPLNSEFPSSYEINIKRFAEHFGIKAAERSFYKELKEAIVNRFWERELSYWDYNKKRTVKERWLIRVEYADREGVIKLYYNPLIKDELQQLTKNFTTYFLSNIVEMKSIYGIRLYEICLMEYKKSLTNYKTSKFTIEIKKLKEILQIDNKYSRFNQMKEFVLERGRVEINKHSDIHVSYKIKKVGRTPHKIEFSIKLKKTEEDFKKDEVALKIKDAKEKDRRTNHKPMHSTSSNITTLGSSVASILKKMEKNID